MPTIRCCGAITRLAAASLFVISMGCGKGVFHQTQPAEKKSSKDTLAAQPKDVPPTPEPDLAIPKKRVSCSQVYTVPAKANPYLAGLPTGKEIWYQQSKSSDVAPADAPVLVEPTDPGCLKAGKALYFMASGLISHKNSDDKSGPEGTPTMIVQHVLGSYYGKSDIKTPIQSLLGVFLAAETPTDKTEVPEMLDFSTPAQRNLDTLSPKVGQIFFIGDGKTDAGLHQKVIVPEGASRLYLAVMDAYEWHNNVGELSCSIEVDAP